MGTHPMARILRIPPDQTFTRLHLVVHFLVALAGLSSNHLLSLALTPHRQLVSSLVELAHPNDHRLHSPPVGRARRNGY
jgi:hypothetical protein